MQSDNLKILSQIPNSGIVQLPGRKFPGVVIQGDTLSNLFDGVRCVLQEAKRLQNEELFYEMLMLAEQLQGQLLHYEETLAKQGIELPYTISVREKLVKDDFAS
jgi:hypothetical protein